MTDVFDFDVLQKLNKALREASKDMTPRSARYLVDSYYQIQEYRTRATNQVKATTDDEKPDLMIVWMFNNMQTLENNLKSSMGIYAANNPTGSWALSVCGIGPVISAGLLAHIDITKAPTVGHIWRFAGLDPSVEWLGVDKAAALVGEVVGSAKQVTEEHLLEVAARTNRRLGNVKNIAADSKTGKITRTSLAKGLAKCPYNQRLKVLAWKIGESFVKVKNNDKDFYGHLYQERKDYEWQNNLNGNYAVQAAEKLRKFKIGKDKDAYGWYAGCYTTEDAKKILEVEDQTKRKQVMKELLKTPGEGVGMLPPAHINERAKRWAVKLFLAHWHEVAYKNHYGCEPPKPYPLAILGHAHKIERPV